MRFHIYAILLAALVAYACAHGEGGGGDGGDEPCEKTKEEENPEVCKAATKQKCLIVHRIKRECCETCKDLKAGVTDAPGETTTEEEEETDEPETDEPEEETTEAADCFPGDSLVETQSGPMKMSDLARSPEPIMVRDESGEFKFSPVVYWMHAHGSRSLNYINIATESGRQISLSDTHLIFKTPCDEAKPLGVHANTVQTGDCVLTREGIEQVTEISREEKLGLYAPVTNEGTIVVDEIVASVWASISDHDMGNFAFGILKMWRSFLPTAIDSYLFPSVQSEFKLTNTITGFIDAYGVFVKN